MLNIDDRILDCQLNNGLTDSELWLLLHIAKRINQNKRTCFPSNYRICQDTGYGIHKVCSLKKSLISKGYITCIQRRDNGRFLTNLYKLTTKFISIFVTLQDIDDLPEEEYNENTVCAFPANDNTANDNTANGKSANKQINNTKQINNKEQINNTELVAQKNENKNENTETENNTFERKEKEKSCAKKEKESNRPAEPKRTATEVANNNGVNVTPQFVLNSREEFINAAKPKEPTLYGTTAEAAEAEAERILAKQKDFVKINLSRGIKLHPDKLHSLFVVWLQMQSEPFNNDAHVWNAFNSAIQKNAISIQQSIQMLNRKDKDAQSESEKPLNIPVNNEYLQRFNFR